MARGRLYVAVAVPIVLTAMLWPVSMRYGLAESDVAMRAAGLGLLAVALAGIVWVIQLALAESPSLPPMVRRAGSRSEYRRGFTPEALTHYPNSRNVIVALRHKFGRRHPAPLVSGGSSENIGRLRQRLEERAETLWGRRIG